MVPLFDELFFKIITIFQQKIPKVLPSVKNAPAPAQFKLSMQPFRLLLKCAPPTKVE